MDIKALEDWQVDESLQLEDLDLTNCDREPIHIPGAIQPHGILMVLQGNHFKIVQISANCSQWLQREAAELLGTPLSEHFSTEAQNKLQRCLEGEFDSVNPLSFRYVRGEEVIQEFDGIVHRLDTERIIVELEPRKSKNTVNFFDFYRFVKTPLDRIRHVQSLDELCQTLTVEIRNLCKFDRVMVYQFAPDGSGHVMAESCRTGLKPFLGLHYPASDIPRQAKRLYTRNLLRIVPNTRYEPVPLLPALDPQTQKPTNLSDSVLRSVSPLHLEYLDNMGVAASMSISILQQGNLWGLIACHHSTPHQLDYEHRTIAEFIGQVAGMEIAAKEEADLLDYRLSLTRLQSRFIQSIAQSQDLIAEMPQEELLPLVGAAGAVVVNGLQQVHVGTTPPAEAITPLVGWLEGELETEVLFQSDRLSEVFPAAQEYSKTASGLLALSISKLQGVYLLWFRPEQVQTVSWGGEPGKAISEDEDGNIRISPRQSFERWQDVVRGQSTAWLSCELDMALELRTNVLGLLLRNADELATVNQELTRSNDELDAFAYIASHDLKEPLRGIYNYSSFLLEDYEAQLDEDGVHKLETLMRLTKRMESLIDSLLHFSRLGRVELELEPTPLNELLDEVLEVLSLSRNSEGVEIKVAEQLPTLDCDRIQLNELYSNLLSNAIKYNDKEKKQIAVGQLIGEEARSKLEAQGLEQETASDSLLYVQDNGIGIRERHLKTVFRIFKRLHAPKRYGGGTGAGLTIVKKIVERHGGVLWVESTYEQGSTFYFTLS